MSSRVDWWFLYIVRCADGTLYTGIARNVEERMAMHETGRGARYTRGRGPFELCAVRRCADKGRALRLEYAVKQLTRSEKEALLAERRLAAFARKTLRARIPSVAATRPPINSRSERAKGPRNPSPRRKTSVP